MNTHWRHGILPVFLHFGDEPPPDAIMYCPVHVHVVEFFVVQGWQAKEQHGTNLEESRLRFRRVFVNTVGTIKASIRLAIQMQKAFLICMIGYQ